MTVRARFTLWFGMAALVTIGGAAFIGRKVISARRQNEFRENLAAAEDGARQAVQAVERQVREALAHLAQPEADPLDRLFLDLRKEEGEVSRLVRREVQRRSSSLMRAGGLDQLVIALEGDLVVAAPHFEALVDEKDPRPRLLARHPDQTPVAWIEVLKDGKITRVLAAQGARSVTKEGYRVHVLAGRELGAALVDGLTRKGAVEARLVDPSDRPIYPERRSAFPASAPSRRIELLGDDGKPVARLVVTVNDADLKEELRAITLAAGALGIIALVFALAVGYLVSRQISRDVDALVVGAQAVSSGDWKHRVPVRRKDELGELAGAFNAMTAQLRESKAKLVQAERVAAWQEIARAIAHEIKNPLTPIQMSVETMRKTYRQQHPSFEEIFEESTRTVLEEVQRLKKIVAEFSEFARLPKPDRQPCSVDEIVGGALALYRGAVRVVEELDGALPPIEADRDQLTQVVLNLLENARDAVTAKGSDESVGRITVRTRKHGERVELEVEDNGPGFDPAILDKLFTPYFTTKEAGTGLGLAIVHRIVTDHGGTITATSNPGKGARFVVDLPIKKGITDSYRFG